MFDFLYAKLVEICRYIKLKTICVIGLGYIGLPTAVLFALKGFKIKWSGEGLDEVGYDEKTGRKLIFISDKYYRPAEVDELLGDSSKARNELGWNTTYTFDDLVKEMVDNDCKI